MKFVAKNLKAILLLEGGVMSLDITVMPRMPRKEKTRDILSVLIEAGLKLFSSQRLSDLPIETSKFMLVKSLSSKL